MQPILNNVARPAGERWARLEPVRVRVTGVRRLCLASAVRQGAPLDACRVAITSSRRAWHGASRSRVLGWLVHGVVAASVLLAGAGRPGRAAWYVAPTAPTGADIQATVDQFRADLGGRQQRRAAGSTRPGVAKSTGMACPAGASAPNPMPGGLLQRELSARRRLRHQRRRLPGQRHASRGSGTSTPNYPGPVHDVQLPRSSSRRSARSSWT